MQPRFSKIKNNQKKKAKQYPKLTQILSSSSHVHTLYSSVFDKEAPEERTAVLNLIFLAVREYLKKSRKIGTHGGA